MNLPEPLDQEETIFQERILELATAVTPQIYQRAKIAYEDARMNGLCHAGAWECAVAAVQIGWECTERQRSA